MQRAYSAFIRPACAMASRTAAFRALLLAVAPATSSTSADCALRIAAGAEGKILVNYIGYRENEKNSAVAQLAKYLLEYYKKQWLCQGIEALKDTN